MYRKILPRKPKTTKTSGAETEFFKSTYGTNPRRGNQTIKLKDVRKVFGIQKRSEIDEQGTVIH